MRTLEEYALGWAIVACVITIIIHIEFIRKARLIRERVRKSHAAAIEQRRISEQYAQQGRDFAKAGIQSYEDSKEFLAAGTQAMLAAKQMDQAG